MKHIKYNYIICALLSFSVAFIVNLYIQMYNPASVFIEYFISMSENGFFDLKNYALKSYLLIDNELLKDETDNYMNNEAAIVDENAAEFLSEDSEFVFECQKSAEMEVSNQTDYSIDKQSLLAEKPDFKIGDVSAPQILIVHTHASESYGYKRNYELTDTDRTQDNNYNMIRVGAQLKYELEKRGYNVLHDQTVHDYPSYTSSYIKAGQTIEKYLKKYPSIVAVFDLHRDAVVDNNGKRVGFVTRIMDEECAQIMIVCGTDKNNLKFDSWEENLRLAFKIQNYMEINYPGIMRPLNIRKERFNLHLTKGSLLFEIGTNGNSLEQALSSVKYLADGVDNVFNRLK